ncbi:hypothetical protein E2542_SST06405 [Spatholobus suberectus]|nr:hypothetical protein E2542_SST06405 [Spatholobus suberectus]
MSRWAELVSVAGLSSPCISTIPCYIPNQTLAKVSKCWQFSLVLAVEPCGSNTKDSSAHICSTHGNTPTLVGLALPKGASVAKGKFLVNILMEKQPTTIVKSHFQNLGKQYYNSQKGAGSRARVKKVEFGLGDCMTQFFLHQSYNCCCDQNYNNDLKFLKFHVGDCRMVGFMGNVIYAYKILRYFPMLLVWNK